MDHVHESSKPWPTTTRPTTLHCASALLASAQKRSIFVMTWRSSLILCQARSRQLQRERVWKGKGVALKSSCTSATWRLFLPLLRCMLTPGTRACPPRRIRQPPGQRTTERNELLKLELSRLWQCRNSKGAS
jgi:hypothetical protein